MAVIFGTSTSDFAGDAIRLQHFRHGEAAEEERKRPGHSRLSPTKSRLFAKWHFLPENEFLECTTVSVGKVPVGSLDSVQAIPFSGVTNPRHRSRGREGGTPRSVELRRPPRLRYRLKNIEIQKQIVSPSVVGSREFKN